MAGRTSIFHDPKQVERLRKILAEEPHLTLAQIGKCFNKHASTIRDALKANNLTRKDLRGVIRKIEPSSTISIPTSYLEYVKKAGYEGLKWSMGELRAFKGKRNGVK